MEQKQKMKRLAEFMIRKMTAHTSFWSLSASVEIFTKEEMMDYMIRKGQDWKDYAKLCRTMFNNINESRI
jgi:hypothetical protein